MKPITIVGGGLAGLALGIALRKRAIPVTLHEAGTYPRHRVCGEFICGVRQETLTTLGIDAFFHDAFHNRTTGWYHLGRKVLSRDLPKPAIGLSRHCLDARLAEAFVELGGTLHQQSRIQRDQVQGEGEILCAGRRTVSESPWIGLKMHCRNLELLQDLEIHVGKKSYCGLSYIEKGRVNVCGLFARAPQIKAPRERLLDAYLRHAGLDKLADRLEQADIDPASHTGVAHLEFKGHWDATPGLALGDHVSHIPPFTGNGMSMAFEGAEVVLPAVENYATGQSDWPKAVRCSQIALRRRFRQRLNTAKLLHPMIHAPLLQPLTINAGRFGLLPFNLLFRLTH